MDTDRLTVAAVQYAGVLDWEQNLQTCRRLLAEAASQGVRLAVLPEAANRTLPPDTAEIPAQGLDGPFVRGLAELSVEFAMVIIAGVIEANGDQPPYNTLVALADGELIATYRKIHMYDAFGAKESDRFTPGDGPITQVSIDGFRVGLLTCYDLRFPEVARLHAVGGADVIVAPSSWVSGPAKEWHWQLLNCARALENTVYVVAAGKSGHRRIGDSMIVDPLGIVRARLGAEEGITSVVLSRAEIASVRRSLPVLQQRRIQLSPTIHPNPRVTEQGEQS